jgi:putative membrane protein
MTNAITTAALSTDHWDGPGPWWPIFPILWLLIVIAIITTFALLGRRRWRYMHQYAGQRAGEARLAERYAAGEIDEQEYERRLATLKRLGSS